jgi:hypothetical protein
MNPRLSFYYEDPRRIGRNDGPPLFWWNTARRLFGKDNSIHLLPNGDWADHGIFDYHFWVDWGEDALMNMLPYSPQTPPKPNIYIASDTHLGYDYRLSRAREFDWVFCNQLKAVEEFIKDGIPANRCMWLPHAAEPLAYPKKEMINRYDVSFVGNVGSWNRVEFLDRMFKEFPNFFYGKRLFEEAAEIYSQSKIVLHISIKDDIAMRPFEVLSTGSFLLCNNLPTMHHLFKEGVHYAGFDTLDEAVEKAKYYISHDAERQRIADAGYAEFMAKHTYEHRLKTVLDIVGANEKVLA